MSAINVGLWINWEYGAIVGATLTLPTYWGLILVSFLTLFVQFVGGCFWRTLCFILHQTRSTTSARDGLYHQQQIILRNAITAPNALWSLARSAVVWKSRVAAPLGRSAPLIFITTFHIICFSAAGLLSSQIASTRAGQALVDSTACGYPKQLPAIRTATALTTSSAELDVFNAQVLLGRFTLTKSQAYVRACYNGDSEETAECGHFVRRSLVGDQASVDMQAACPFGRDACMTKAFRVDSGLLDSNKDIGLNEPPKNSVSFRRVTTCAPIQVDRYASVWRDNLTEVYGKKTNTSIRFYEFGKSDTGCMAAQPEHTTNQTTFCISKWMRDYLPGAYNIVANTAYAGNFSASDFKPIADFQVANADVTLISILNKAVYNGKVDDELFNAQTKAPDNDQFFLPTSDFAVLGCTEQYQFCNTETHICTDLGGLYATRASVRRGDIGLSKRQQAMFSVLWDAAWTMVLQWSARLLNSHLLLAQDWVFTATSFSSSSLAPGQWQRETHNIHNLSLSMFQHRIDRHSSPDTFELRPGLNALEQLDVPTDPDILDLCKRQRILSARHYSVSVLGMAIILVVGSLLITLDQTIETLWFRYFQAGYQLAKRAEWSQTSTLNLHRQALEARGIGPWERKNHDFPVMEARHKTFTGLSDREGWIGGDVQDEKKMDYQVVDDQAPPSAQGLRSFVLKY